MHLSTDAILEAAGPADEDGYRYVAVVLDEDGSCDNPASTKHDLYGPAVFFWQVHPSGIRVTELAGVDEIPNDVRVIVSREAGALRGPAYTTGPNRDEAPSDAYTGKELEL